jgi:hypothetical protein
MKNSKDPFIIFGLIYILSGIVLNIRMYFLHAWPTFLFFILIIFGILLLLSNQITKRIKNYRLWQTIIALIPVAFYCLWYA